MKRYQKIAIFGSVIVLLAAGCNTSQPQGTGQPPSATGQSAVTDVGSKGRTQTRQNAGKPDYKQGYIIVSQSVEGSNLNEPYTQVLNGATAWDLLAAAHKVEFKSYSGLGEMATAIDGIKPDNKHFWSFYVNGASSNVGASSYVLKDGDRVEWKLGAISSSGQ